MKTAWHSFRCTPLGELVSGTAHVAHPTDITSPLGVRFAGQTLLAVHVALEKAATVRVAFDRDGRPRLSGIRHIRQRTSQEFSDVVRAEVTATRACWALVVLATGWQAVLGQRSARPEPAEALSSFARHKLMIETPEVVVPRAQADRVYTAVDHPVLDKSLVFSVRRRELEDLFHELRRCGVGVASVRIALAAQLETWLAAEGEAGLSRDILLSDGLTALLLNVEGGDFVPPRGAVEAEQPRQSVQRPSTVEEDMVRFIEANAARSVTFLGPEELCAAVKGSSPNAEIVRPPGHAAHDMQLAVLSPHVEHDLNFEAREVRPALPRAWRRLGAGLAAVAVLLLAVAGFNGFYTLRVGLQSYRLERELASQAMDEAAAEATRSALATDYAAAAGLRSWVTANYNAQRFTYGLLRTIPPSAALDRLLVELRDGQLTLTFIILGDQDTQLAAHRAIETAIKELKYKIGGEELPVGTAGSARAVQYRLHLIVPDPAEGSS